MKMKDKIRYTDAEGVKHEIKLLKTKLSFPEIKEEEIEALKKEIAERELMNIPNNPIPLCLGSAEWEVYYLKEKSGLSYKEIAEIRGTTQSTARDQYRNAQRKIKQIKNGFTEL